MKSIETEGKNVEQAIELGLYKLGLNRDEVTIQILEQGGLFSKAKVKIVSGEQTEEEKVFQKYFDDLITVMQISCFASVEISGNKVNVNLTGNDVGIMIGKRGDVLNAIQFVTSQIFNKNRSGDEYYRVVVDSSNYISRREESLRNLAKSSANKAIKSKKPIKLNYMSAKERRIIHEELAKNELVKTESRGEDPKRFVVITPTNKGKNAMEEFNLKPRVDND